MNAPRGIRGSTTVPSLGTVPSRSSLGGGSCGQRSARGTPSSARGSPSPPAPIHSRPGVSPCMGRMPTGPAFKGSSGDANSIRDAMRRTPGAVRAMMMSHSAVAGPGGSRWRFEMQNVMIPELRRVEVENDDLQRRLAAAEAKAARYAAQLADIQRRVGDTLGGAGMNIVERRCESPSAESSSFSLQTSARGDRREPTAQTSPAAGLNVPAPQGITSPLGGLSPRPPSSQAHPVIGIPAGQRLEHPVEVVAPASPVGSPGRVTSPPLIPTTRSPRSSSEQPPITPPPALMPAALMPAATSCSAAPAVAQVQPPGSSALLLPALGVEQGPWMPAPLPEEEVRRIEALGEGMSGLGPPGMHHPTERAASGLHTASGLLERRESFTREASRSPARSPRSFHTGSLGAGLSAPASAAISPELMSSMLAQLSAVSAASNSCLNPSATPSQAASRSPTSVSPGHGQRAASPRRAQRR